jgi:hypothetical protein
MRTLSTKLQRLAKAIFDLGAVQFGKFHLKLHETHPKTPLPPIYFNLRISDNPKTGLLPVAA